MSTPSSLRVSIIGGSGYAGGELLRLLDGHPHATIAQITSESMRGKPVTIAHPNMRSRTSLTFCSIDDIQPCDLLFVCLPNGESQKHMASLTSIAPRIIDLGADYRLDDPRDYQTWYGRDHSDPARLASFVYGVAELTRDRIRDASYVACGGCEATVSILTLYPLYLAGVVDLDAPLIIDAKMSSSQAGKRSTASSHHPERAGCVRTYQPTGHRHTAEINQYMKQTSKIDDPGLLLPIGITATSIDMVRGLLVTAHVHTRKRLSDIDLLKIYKRAYRNEPFVRVLFEKSGLYRMPEPKIVAGTNYCDIGFATDPHSHRVVCVGAIDNLVKGTSGQAIQNMNIMMGRDETLGLSFPGLHPV